MTVRDSKWALAVEVALNPRTLTCFVCDSFDDLKTLEQLLAHARIRRPPMIVSRCVQCPLSAIGMYMAIAAFSEDGTTHARMNRPRSSRPFCDK